MGKMSNPWRKYLISGVILLSIFVVIVIATHNLLTEPYPGHNDFLSRWEGTRSFWIDGLNPYGEEASHNIQVFMYGRPALETEDQVLFAYPMYTAILIAPLVFMSYPWASAIIMVTMEVMLIVAAILLLDMFNWKPRIGHRALILIAALFYYGAARGLILGQLGLISYFMYVVTFWGLSKDRDWLAGIALSLATIKPQLGFLIVPFLLLWGLRAKRWQFVGAFAVSLGILMGISFILVPTWLMDMWQQVTQYTGYAPPGPSEVLFEQWLGLPSASKYVFFSVFWFLMLLSWYPVLIQGKLERSMWAAMVTLAVSNIATPVMASPHFTVFFILWVFYLRELSRRPKHKMWVWVILILLIVEPWVRFFVTLDYVTTLESAWMAYPEPILILITLWFTRQLWWDRGAILKASDATQINDEVPPQV